MWRVKRNQDDDDTGATRTRSWISYIVITLAATSVWMDCGQDFGKMISNITTSDPSSSSTSSSSSSSVHLVMAGKNNNWTEEIVSKLKSIHTYRRREEEEESSSSLSYYPTQSSSFQMHKLEKAGHWVHVDDLEGLLRLMINEIQRQRWICVGGEMFILPNLK